MPKVPKLPRAVVALGLVSLATDLSSEMIYPLLPAFLVGLGASGTFIGLIEGVAESTSALLKLTSGVWADRVRRRKPLVLLGYGLASLARPLVALARLPWQVLAVRFVDRVGKGVRTSPRDALIADATPADRRGAAYGFHRAMDHAGAVLGPLVAFALLAAGVGMRGVFALAAIPAALAMVILFVGVREPERPGDKPASAVRPRLRDLPPPLRRTLVFVGVFTLGNASDAFLLLAAHGAGIPTRQLPLLWAAFHVVKSVLSTPLGAASDRLGRRQVIIVGWAIYAMTYVGFMVATAAWQIWALFLFYGAYYAFTEGAEKALVADLAPPEARGSAFGAFHFVVGIAALPASLIFGLLWDRVSHAAAFGLGAALAGIASIGLWMTVRK